MEQTMQQRKELMTMFKKVAEGVAKDVLDAARERYELMQYAMAGEMMWADSRKWAKCAESAEVGIETMENMIENMHSFLTDWQLAAMNMVLSGLTLADRWYRGIRFPGRPNPYYPDVNQHGFENPGNIRHVINGVGARYHDFFDCLFEYIFLTTEERDELFCAREERGLRQARNKRAEELVSKYHTMSIYRDLCRFTGIKPRRSTYDMVKDLRAWAAQDDAHLRKMEKLVKVQKFSSRKQDTGKSVQIYDESVLAKFNPVSRRAYTSDYEEICHFCKRIINPGEEFTTLYAGYDEVARCAFCGGQKELDGTV